MERMRAPGLPAEPQSTSDEQRHYCRGQMFCFHCLLFFKLHIHFQPMICECDRNVTKPDQFRDEIGGKRDESKTGRPSSRRGGRLLTLAVVSQTGFVLEQH
jgi:hypothetical protein